MINSSVANPSGLTHQLRARNGEPSSYPQGTLRTVPRLAAGALTTSLFAAPAAAQNAIPTGGGSATSPVGFLLIGVVALAAVHQFTNYSLWPPEEARETLGLTNTTTGGGSGTGGVAGFLTSRNGILLGAVVFLGALVLGGFLGLPDGAGVQLIVALELVALYLVLRELGAYSFRMYAVVGAITTVLALSALGEPIIASILNSQPGVILVIGGLYLGWRYLQQRRSEQNQPIIVETKNGGDD